MSHQVMSDTKTGYTNTPIDIKLRLSALWIATMFIYAYVDIFNLMRADFLEGLLDGEIVNTPLTVNQGFLIFAVVYILPASLMVYFSLTLSPVGEPQSEHHRRCGLHGDRRRRLHRGGLDLLSARQRHRTGALLPHHQDSLALAASEVALDPLVRAAPFGGPGPNG